MASHAAETTSHTVTRQILAALRDDGYAISAINYLAADGGGVKLTAWRRPVGEVWPPDAEVWTAKGPTRYEAAVALAGVLGWEMGLAERDS